MTDKPVSKVETPTDQLRLARLEEHVAHQQRTIDELSDQLAKQWKIIDQLRNKLERLTERFLSLEAQSIDAPAITKPPHY